jgi:serine/threonine protein kinase
LFEREIHALSRRDISAHSNIIQIESWGYDYPSFTSLNVYPMMMVEKAIGPLKSFLKEEPKSADTKRHLCLNIAEGLRHVHGCDIIHGDLKPGNVLIVRSMDALVPFTAKLADFGTFVDFKSTSHDANGIQSIHWYAELEATRGSTGEQSKCKGAAAATL